MPCLEAVVNLVPGLRNAKKLAEHAAPALIPIPRSIGDEVDRGHAVVLNHQELRRRCEEHQAVIAVGVISVPWSNSLEQLGVVAIAVLEDAKRSLPAQVADSAIDVPDG